MGEPGELRQPTARDAVVHPLARVAERPCARPGCPAPARASLTFSYATAEAVLERLSEVADPQAYDLCVSHAERTDPPRGWKLTDKRPEDERDAVEVPAPKAQHLGSDATVAVLAAALRAVPDRPAEPAPPAEPAEAVDAEPAAPSMTLRDPASEPTTELPRLRTPRPIPAVADRPATRPPATDW